MKILIFGSNGLVGSSLNRLLSNKSNISLTSSTRRDTDLFSYIATKKIIDDVNPDLIINAAARVGGINANNLFRTQFILENLKINMNILESVISKPKIKIINLGSSCIYPLNANNPINESSLMTGKLEPTNSPYAMAKLTSIEIGNAISIEYGNKIINLMPTNLYGPNDNFSDNNSHVIPGLINRVYKSKQENLKTMTVWGTGNPLREFLFVDDLSDAVNFIINNNIEDEIINIGSGQEISIKNLAKKIKKIIDFDGDIFFDKSLPDGNPKKMLDSSKINNYGWTSSTDLDKGLEITCNWYKNNLIN